MKRLVILSSFFFPSFALAASVMPYDLLAPIAGTTQISSLKDYLNLIFRAAIGITGVLAVIMIVICGIRLMGTPSVSGKSEAKQCIWNAIFGIVIVLGSWLLLNTINPQLLQNDVTVADITAAPTAGAPGVIIEPQPTTPGWYYRFIDAAGNTRNQAAGNSAETCTRLEDDAQKRGITITQKCFEIRKVPQLAGEAATRNAICGNNSCVGSLGIPIGINRGSCSFCGQTKCTNVDGLPSSAISAIQSLQSAVGVNIIITGGTECKHTTHAPGLPIFDLDRNGTLVTFIFKNATVKNNQSFNKNRVRTYKWLYNGYWYTDEGNHFHVCKDGTTYSGPEANKVIAIKEGCNQT